MRLLSSWLALWLRNWHSKRILPVRRPQWRIEKGWEGVTFPALLRYLGRGRGGDEDTENPRIHRGYGGLKN